MFVFVCVFVCVSGAPIVVKADGLCAGKGVIICETVEDGYKAVDEMMSDKVSLLLS